MARGSQFWVFEPVLKQRWFTISHDSESWLGGPVGLGGSIKWLLLASRLSGPESPGWPYSLVWLVPAIGYMELLGSLVHLFNPSGYRDLLIWCSLNTVEGQRQKQQGFWDVDSRTCTVSLPSYFISLDASQGQPTFKLEANILFL